mmetsp:Transcript_17515/g.48597  ORF Transcript_17515/g.48597 Transcript_17515/m.48597 type:complete len:223 (-) Transcript_17515:190-858(-)
MEPHLRWRELRQGLPQERDQRARICRIDSQLSGQDRSGQVRNARPIWRISHRQGRRHHDAARRCRDRVRLRQKPRHMLLRWPGHVPTEDRRVRWIHGLPGRWRHSRLPNARGRRDRHGRYRIHRCVRKQRLGGHHLQRTVPHLLLRRGRMLFHHPHGTGTCFHAELFVCQVCSIRAADSDGRPRRRHPRHLIGDSQNQTDFSVALTTQFQTTPPMLESGIDQ